MNILMVNLRKNAADNRGKIASTETLGQHLCFIPTDQLLQVYRPDMYTFTGSIVDLIN